jgi:hypothetical protein
LSGQGGVLTLSVKGEPVFETNLQGRIGEIELEAGAIRLTLPPIAREGSWIEFPARAIASATLDGRPVTAAGRRIVLLPTRAAQRLEVGIA